ncbi:hypothetical protein ACTXT7_016875, partial [Hymenolepis weldensis]
QFTYRALTLDTQLRTPYSFKSFTSLASTSHYFIASLHFSLDVYLGAIEVEMSIRNTPSTLRKITNCITPNPAPFQDLMQGVFAKLKKISRRTLRSV